MFLVHPTAIDQHFQRSRQQFDDLLGRLASEELRTMPHSHLEQLLDRDGRALIRQLLQDHLDLRHRLGERPASLSGGDGLLRTHRRVRRRSLQTIFGPVTVTRHSFAGRGLCGLQPRDGELNLPKDSFSFGVRKRIARELAKSSYEETAEALADTTGATVAKRQVEQLAQRAAVDFDAFYEQRAAAARQQPAPAGPILTITSDGKGLAMHRQDLRPATRKAAAAQRHKLHKRLCAGEKRHRKRMATVAAVFTTEPFVRTPEEVVDELQRQASVARRPRPEHKRVWASVEKEPEEVIGAAFAEAAARDPDRQRRWVAVVDGNKPQIALLIQFAALYKVKLTIIVDIIHVLEYLWKAAIAVCGAGRAATERWVTQLLASVLKGHGSYVALGLRRTAAQQGLSQAAVAALIDAAEYLEDYADYQRYEEYLAAGLPIASGVVEGACRYLVQDRMNRTGARWRLVGAEAVLRLRSLLASGDFEVYWRFHEEREYERNHAHLYPKVVALPQPAQGADDLPGDAKKAAA